MEAQAAVVAARGPRIVGRTEDVLVEELRGRGRWVGRTAWQAPGIDGVVRGTGAAEPGDLVPARVTGAEGYDLHAEVVAPEVERPALRP
jgi:ribosomal protein S12 methylthiotransferase